MYITVFQHNLTMTLHNPQPLQAVIIYSGQRYDITVRVSYYNDIFLSWPVACQYWKNWLLYGGIIEWLLLNI